VEVVDCVGIVGGGGGVVGGGGGGGGGWRGVCWSSSEAA